MPNCRFGLQKQEMQQQQLSTKQREVLGIIQQNQFKAKSVEDPQLLARARSLMPLDSWRTAAQQQYELNRQLEPGTPTIAVEDLIVKSMLRWFKQDFFSWVRPAFAQAAQAAPHRVTQLQAYLRWGRVAGMNAPASLPS